MYKPPLKAYLCKVAGFGMKTWVVIIIQWLFPVVPCGIKNASFYY